MKLQASPERLSFHTVNSRNGVYSFVYELRLKAHTQPVLGPANHNVAPEIKVMNVKELDDANIYSNGVHNQFQQ